MDEKISEYKKKLEAILFASGKRLSLDELSRLTRIRDLDAMKSALKSLKEDYDKKESSLIIEDIEEDGVESWKLTVHNQMIPLIKKIITKTELKKSVIETLAYIAYKYPIKQSDIVKVRSNKAYEHLSELEKAGYISRKKHGRTNLIKLTDKFFDYFDLPPEKIKDQFRDFEQLEKAIEEKDQEIKKMVEEHKRKAEEAKKIAQKEKKEDKALDPDLDQIEIDLLDKKGHKEKLEIYDEDMTPADKIHTVDIKPEIKEVKDKLGELEIVEEALPELEEEMKKKDHLGKLEVFEEGEAEDKEEPSEESGEIEEVSDEISEEEPVEEEPVEEEPVEEEPVEEEPEKTEEITEQKPEEPVEEESGIETELKEQKEKLKPEEHAKFGKGFEEKVEKYMEEKAEERAEEMMHPKQEVKEEEKSVEEESIKMPEAHEREIPSEEEQVEEETEEKEPELISTQEVIKEVDEEQVPELPPMDDFEEEEKIDKESKIDQEKKDKDDVSS